MTPQGPSHLTAGASRVVSFCLLAHRRKCRVSRRSVALSLAVHSSRLPCRASGERKAVCGEPIEESDRGSYVLPDEDVLVVGGVGASCTLSQAPQHVPKGVAAQQVLFIGICSLGDGGVDPVFESHHVFVAGGQDFRGDQDAAQVLDCLAGGQLVECWW